MKRIPCRMVAGVRDCPFVAQGTTDEEAKKQLWEHIHEHHPEVAGALTPEEHAAMDRKMDEVLGGQRSESRVP